MDAETIEEDIDGCIHSIHVKNFFCHDNLEVNLNRNVNFIVGRNGSGKSAILTALVVGLGSRASVTNRGSNLQSFVKKGQNSATIEIKIKNNSAKAYKRNLYGDYITIARHINASGGSSYKVKSSSGEVISTKFEEVNSIVLAHDIQVDNPISVLNQDDARSFHASDSKKKYSLFRKATNLDQTETNYIRALDNCNKATAIWNRKNHASIELEKEYKKWRTSHEQMQSRDEMEVQKQALQNEYYWSEIAELEKEANTIQHQYDMQKAKMEKVIEKISNIKKNSDSKTDAIQTLKDQLKEKSSAKSTSEQDLQRLKSAEREAQAAWRQAQAACGTRRDLLRREASKVAELQREIRDIESGNASSVRGALEERAEETRRAAAAVGARYDTAQHEAAQAGAGLARARAREEEARARAQLQRDNIRQLKQQLRELESRGGDSLAVYGARMAELRRRLDQAAAAGQFSAPPRGPIGSYLKVKEKRWGGALEHIIGGSIQGFCVNTPEDSRKLFKIMTQVYGSGPKPGVSASEFFPRAHDVRRRETRAPGAASALAALHAPDPVVANFLIDNLRLESILLVPEHADASRLASAEENVPENCTKIVTLDGTEFLPAPSYRCYGGAARASRYLQVSTHERKKQLQAEISEAESSLAGLEAAAAEATRQAAAARDAARAASRALEALLAARHEAAGAATEAANALDQHQAPQQSFLVEELNISKEKLQTLQEDIDAFTQKDEEYRQQVDDYNSQIKTVTAALKEASAACRNLSEEIEQEQLKFDQGVTEQRTWEQRVREDRVRLAQVEGILGERRAVVGTKVHEALTLCPRIERPRDKMIVMNELKKVQLKLSSLRADGLTKAEVAERLLLVERRYRRTKHTLDRLKLLIDDIKSTTDNHLKFCHRVQSYIARRVQYCFQSILSLRGFSGGMKIDNARGVLEIVCAGRESSAKRVAASTSSLSGGERSYSTVAFIMALWECVELPFYFMDEFDVFMDDVNRKIVMELLIDYALKNKSRQFVFLTPQDASTVTASPHIAIHLMADPRP